MKMSPCAFHATSVGWRNMPLIGGSGGVASLPRLGLVGGFLLAPEHHQDAAFRVELDDHVRALVDGPDVVVFVDAHIVRKRQNAYSPLPISRDELAIGSEFEKLRGGRGERRSRSRWRA